MHDSMAPHKYIDDAREQIEDICAHLYRYSPDECDLLFTAALDLQGKVEELYVLVGLQQLGYNE